MGCYFIRIRCAYSGTTTKKITKQVQKLDKERVKRKLKKTKHQPGGTTARRAGTTARTQAAAPDVLPLEMKTCVEFQAAVLPPRAGHGTTARGTGTPENATGYPTVPPGTRFVLPPGSAINPSGTTAGAAVLPLDLRRFGLKPM